MRSFEDSDVYILVAVIGVIAIVLGFCIGIIADIQPNSGCTTTIQERTLVKEVNITNLDYCLDFVKDSDMFQKRLYNKSWMVR